MTNGKQMEMTDLLGLRLHLIRKPLRYYTRKMTQQHPIGQIPHMLLQILDD